MKTKKVTVEARETTITQDDITMVSLLAKGGSMESISIETGENKNTIAFRLANLRSKFNCANSTELVAYFLRKKLIN